MAPSLLSSRHTGGPTSAGSIRKETILLRDGGRQRSVGAGGVAEAGLAQARGEGEDMRDVLRPVHAEVGGRRAGAALQPEVVGAERHEGVLVGDVVARVE